eukprot:GHVU01071389.1.p1 GENE.GHVU01071389.1~~GHVU01071389.1.p1  ORF type:complete len:216 (+),score=32.91 GHVU01071389.1:757-1404(+)
MVWHTQARKDWNGLMRDLTAVRAKLVTRDNLVFGVTATAEASRRLARSKVFDTFALSLPQSSRVEAHHVSEAPSRDGSSQRHSWVSYLRQRVESTAGGNKGEAKGVQFGSARERYHELLVPVWVEEGWKIFKKEGTKNIIDGVVVPSLRSNSVAMGNVVYEVPGESIPAAADIAKVVIDRKAVAETACSFMHVCSCTLPRRSLCMCKHVFTFLLA